MSHLRSPWAWGYTDALPDLTERTRLAEQRPAPLGAVLRAIKDVLDPAGILNPGVLLDLER